MEMTIVGGGIAGLAAAIALGRQGFPCRVLEQSPAFDEQGAGLQLGPNGVKALERLGLWSVLERLSYAPPNLHIMDAPSGELIRSFALDAFKTRFGAPYRVAHRRDLLKCLLSLAHDLKSIELLPDHRVTGVSWAGDNPLLSIDGGKQLLTTALIGADGLHSVVRRDLLADGPPTRHELIIYRALLPRLEAAHLSNDVVLWLSPGGHIVHYPVSAGREMNIVAVTESLRSGGHDQQDCSSAGVSARFEPMSPDLRYVLGLAPSWRRWIAADRPAAGSWGKGRATLIGDAAHPMLPTLAQGAVAALEDSVTLADCLTPQGDVAVAFRRYEQLRQARTARLQRASRMQSAVYHLDGGLRKLRNSALRHIPESFFLSRIAWIYV